MASTAGVLMISGSVLFFVGAAVGVSRVFVEPDRDEKLRMLTERLLWWRVGQPLYAGGALVAALGIGALAADSPATSGIWLAAAGVLTTLGALAWSWSCYRRGLLPREFALGKLSGWPFAAYVWLTLAGLLLLGVGLLRGDGPAWAGWLVLVADALITAAYVRFGDIPPFVFYLLLTVVGIAVL